MITDREMQALRLIEAFIRAEAPYDTGNLALNSIRIIADGDTYCVAVGGEIAPYAVYTNETRKKGKNPNEGWLNNAVKGVIPYVERLMRSDMPQKEYDELMKSRREAVEQLQKRKADMLKYQREQV